MFHQQQCPFLLSQFCTPLVLLRSIIRVSVNFKFEIPRSPRGNHIGGIFEQLPERKQKNKTNYISNKRSKALIIERCGIGKSTYFELLHSKIGISNFEWGKFFRMIVMIQAVSEWFHCILLIQSEKNCNLSSLLSSRNARYNAIVHPLRKRITKQRAFLHIFVIWLASSMFAFPMLIFSRTSHVRVPYGPDKGQILRTVCHILWPDGYQGKSKLDFV